MAGNATPRFLKNNRNDSCLVSAANVSSDGDGNLTTPTSYLLMQADSTNGSFVEKVRVMCSASAASTATAATVLRFFVSTVASGATTNANTKLIAEVAVPAITAAHPTIPVPPFEVELNLPLAASETLIVTTHTVANANTKWHCQVMGAGDY